MKQFTHLYTKLLCILALLTVGVSSVWGYWTTDRNGNAQADNASIQGYVSNSGSTYYVLDDVTERNIELNIWGNHVEYNYNINGPAGILTFETKKERRTALGNLKVAQRIIGGGWSDKYNKNPGTSYEGSGNITLDEKAVELSFYSEDNGGAKRYFKNVKVTMASYCVPETASVAFGSDLYLKSENKTLKVYWSNNGTQIISKTGDTGRFTLSTSSIPSQKGYYGNTVVTITYKRDVVGSHTMTLRINGQDITVTGTTTKATPDITECAEASEIEYNTLISTSSLTPGAAVHPTNGTAVSGSWNWVDGSLLADCHEKYMVQFVPDDKGYNTQTCEISVPITKLPQTISWTLLGGEECATGKLMDATTESGMKIDYYSSNKDWGYINENNRLVVIVPNETIRITARQEGDCNWMPVEETREIITLGANPNQHEDVHATSITYGDLLGASTLSGKVYLDEVEIAGTLSWVDPMIMPVAGTANHMVLFTPTNTAAYSSVYFEVPVTVAKANPVITWNISSALRENTIYKNIAVSSNREETLTLTETSDYLSVSGLSLTVGEIGDTEKANIIITAHQKASANYNEVTATFTITIYPKVAQCVPAVVNSQKVLDNMGAKYVAPSGWCATTETVNGKYEVLGVSWLSFDVQYPQYEGIQLGAWSQGLNSLGTDFWTNLASSLSSLELEGTDKDIELKFTGIPDSLFFDTKLQTVSFKLINWTPAKQKNPVWTVYERTIDGTERQVGDSYDAYNTTSIKLPLDSTTRSVRIQIHSAFAGFIQNLRITQKRYIRADKESLVFGTDSKPLQEPQTLTLSYSSLGDCAGTDDKITVTSSNPAFYVDETTITENVGIEQMGSYTIRVRCNDVNQSGKITFESNDGTQLEVPVSSTKPTISALTAGTAIFQTGTERAPYGSTPYRALRTHNFFACFDADENALFDALYIYGVSESSAADRQWSYDASKGYNVPTISASNVHTPCFVYKKDGKQYTYDHTFDASTETLNIAEGKHIFVGYKPESSAATAIQVNGANTELYLNNTEIIASGAPFAINATSAVYANEVNIISSTGNAAVQLSGATTLTVEDTWTGDATSAILALRPAASYPSIDLGSASGRVDVNGTQLTLRNATNMAIAHMEGTTEHFDGEVHINDGSIGGEATLGMPKNTFIDGGTFNDGTVVAYTLKGMPKRPRNSRGDMLSRHTMSKDALASAYSWYGQAHLTQDGASKVNPMLMDEVVWIFTGDAGESYDDADSWNKDGVPSENDDVLINAPMVISGGEMKLHGITINWVDGEHGVPAITVKPDGGLTVGEDGVDGATEGNLALRADQDSSSVTKGQTGFLRIHPNSAEPMPEATVELFSTAYYDMTVSNHNQTGEWQFVGYPMRDGAAAKTVFSKSFLYDWDSSSSAWVNNRKNCVLQPFQGYATSQYKNVNGWLTTFSGVLVENKDTIINLAYNEGSEFTYNMLANSYSAPIDIAHFDDKDFNGIQAAVYIFNTGSREDIKNLGEMRSGSCNIPGQYLTIPIGSARDMKDAFSTPTIIAPMQGFYVHATDSNAFIRLNYDSLVWKAANKNAPLHAPVRKAREQVGSLCVSLYGEGVADNLYILESDKYDVAFENGYDAKKMNSGEANIFAVEGDQQLAVDATNNIVGTHIGVRAGETTTYTMGFSHMSSEHDLLLFDAETTELLGIYEGLEYTFNVEPNTTITDRFIILEREKTPEVTTVIENAAANSVKVKKFIKDNQLYILKNGVLYNATGARVH